MMQNTSDGWRQPLWLLLWLLLLSFSSAPTLATDISLSITVSPTPAILNKSLTYTVRVFPIRTTEPSIPNSSPPTNPTEDSSTISEVVLTYGLPPSFLLISATSSNRGTCQSNGVLECQLGTITGAVTVTIVVTPTMTGTINSYFSVNGLADKGKKVTKLTEPTSITVNKPTPVQVSFSETTYLADESQGTLKITVTRNGDSDRAVFVDYISRDGTAQGGQDYEPVQGTLSWPEGDTTPKSFEIKLLDDLMKEEEETILLELSNPQEATLGQGQAQVLLKDTKVTGEVGFKPQTYLVNESAGTVVIKVGRTGGRDGALSVNYTTTDSSAVAGKDYVTTSGILTWGSGEEGEQEISVKLLNDELPEPTETFSLTLSNPTNRGTLSPNQEVATVTIQNDNRQYDAAQLLSEVARNPVQRAIATTLGHLCQTEPTGPDLQQQCLALLTQVRDQPLAVAKALQQIAPEEFTAQGRLSIEAASRQVHNLHSRLLALRSGAVGLLNVEQLQLEVQGQTVPLPSDLDFRLRGQPLTNQAGTPLTSGTAHALAMNKLGIFINGHLGFGDKQTTDRETGFDFNTLGLTAGIDYRVSDTVILGVALGYHQGEAELSEESGGIDSQGLNLAVYGTFYRPQQFFIDVLYGYGLHWYDNTRNIVYALGETQVNQIAHSETDADDQIFSLSAGYHFHFRNLTVTPTLRMDNLSFGLDEFQETFASATAPGSGLGLAIDSQTVKSLTVALGSQLSLELKQPSGVIWLPQLQVEWIQESQNKQRSLTGRFLADPSGERFTLLTDEPDTSYAKLGMGLIVQFNDSTSALVNYETLWGLREMTNQSLMGSVRLEF
ncbi:MAG: hypothetical protein BWK78_00930 [Thiotrichaceae bacterium IS1]|nr:MAG: hypothetical protein BWK78_00930 [Thiotrichaceae bacterium IS1]